MTGLSITNGYYSVWAAAWAHVTMTTACPVGTSLSYLVTFTNVATGIVDYQSAYVLAADGGMDAVIDDDFAPFSTAYDVKASALDSSGNVLSWKSIGTVTSAAPSAVTGSRRPGRP